MCNHLGATLHAPTCSVSRELYAPAVAEAGEGSRAASEHAKAEKPENDFAIYGPRTSWNPHTASTAPLLHPVTMVTLLNEAVCSEFATSLHVEGGIFWVSSFLPGLLR